MPAFIQRKLRAKFIGNEDYRPKNFEQKGFVPVIGFESRKVPKTFNGESKVVDEMFLIIIDDHGKIVSAAAFNFAVMIDQIDEDAGKIAQTLNNATLLLKQLSEKNALREDKNK